MDETVRQQEELNESVAALKAERNATILAHNYQPNEIQLIADHLGDSLELARLAARLDSEVIVFCGVHFMAESTAVLAPDKTVLLPAIDAGCPMADMVAAPALREKKKMHPDAAVVCYINSAAEVKAESDICCTSANAVQVVNSLPDDEILFVPDRNLALYTQRFTDKKIIPWQGYCLPHHRFTPDDVQRAREQHPDAVVIVHPECVPEVIDIADEVLSTGGMIRFAKETDVKEIIVGTEVGLVDRLQRENPDKVFHHASSKLFCINMKKTDLELVEAALDTLEPRITVPDDTAAGARMALERMLEIPRAQ